jgi:hypothetical protein
MRCRLRQLPPHQNRRASYEPDAMTQEPSPFANLLLEDAVDRAHGAYVAPTFSRPESYSPE